MTYTCLSCILPVIFVAASAAQSPVLITHSESPKTPCSDTELDRLDRAIRADSTKALLRYRRGLHLRSCNRFGDALEEFSVALRHMPDDTLLLVSRGLTYLDTGDIPRAAADFARIQTLWPRYAKGYRLRGLAYLRSGDEDSALQSFSQALRIDSTDSESCISRGLIFDKRRSFHQSEIEYTRAIGLNSGNPFYRVYRAVALVNMRQFSGAAADLNIASRIALRNPELQATIGLAYHNCGMFDSALAVYKRILDISPGNPYVLLQMARVFGQRGMPDSVIAVCTKLTGVDSLSQVVLLMRGKAYLDIGSSIQALADFDTAVIRDTVCVECLKLRSTALRKLGRFDAAIQACNRALEIDSLCAGAYTCRASALKETGALAGAADDFTNAIRLGDTLTADIYFERARVQSELLEWQLAMDDYGVIMRKWPQKADAFVEAGILMKKSGAVDSAMVLFNKALRSDSLNARAHANRGMLLGESGKIGEAEKSLRRALLADSGDITILLTLAGVVVQRKNDTGAVKLYTKALQKLPNSTEYLLARAECYNRLKFYDSCDADLAKAFRTNLQIPAFDMFLRKARLFENRGYYAEGIAACDSALTYNSSDAGCRDLRGICYLGMGNADSAIEDFTRALSVNRQVKAYWKNRGDAFSQAKEYRLSIDDYSQALQLRPNDFDALARRARAYMAWAQTETAVSLIDSLHWLAQKDLMDSRKIHPEFADACAGLAALFALQKQFGLALAEIDRAIQLAPQQASHYAMRSSLFSHLGAPDRARNDSLRSEMLRSAHCSDYNLQTGAMFSDALVANGVIVKGKPARIEIAAHNPFESTLEVTGNWYIGKRPDNLFIARNGPAITLGADSSGVISFFRTSPWPDNNPDIRFEWAAKIGHCNVFGVLTPRVVNSGYYHAYRIGRKERERVRIQLKDDFQEVSGNRLWQGPGDLSADVWLKRTRRDLSVRIDVRDDTLVEATAPPWVGDCVEIFFDVRQKQWRGIFEQEYGWFQLSVFPSIDRKSATIFQYSQIDDSIRGIRVKSSGTAHGYALDIAIPIKQLSALHGVPEEEFLFDVAVKDSDNPTAVKSVMIWSGHSIENFRKPEEWGRVVLLPRME